MYYGGGIGEGTYSGVSSPQETEKLTGNGNKYDNVKLLGAGLSTKATSSSGDESVDYARRFLPPLWVDIQEEIERHIEDVTKKSNNRLPNFLSERAQEIVAEETQGKLRGRR